MQLGQFRASADGKEIPVSVLREDGKITATVRKEDIPAKTAVVCAFGDVLSAAKGEEGYHVVATAPGAEESYLTYFDRERTEPQQRSMETSNMPVFGRVYGDGAVLAVAVGSRYQYRLFQKYDGNRYFLEPRYYLEGAAPEEDISVEFHLLPAGSDFSDMMLYYRQYRLDRGEIRYLKDKAAEREELAYAMESILLRIRMAWKPAPPTVLEQTPENEPPLHIACTFERVRKIAGKMKEAGIDRAEITLIGWNISGHDGRWPQYFPVEEKLGGEAELKKTIRFVQSLGYRLTLHANFTDAYSIADNFDRDDLIVTPSGTYGMYERGWSGGRLYQVCPRRAMKLCRESWERMAALGIRGLNYTDVLTVVPLRRCLSDKHPSTMRQSLEANEEMMALSQKLFGGFSSEGGVDFAARYLDYGLYVNMGGRVTRGLGDVSVPLWQIVYGGCILNNPYCSTVNYVVKEPVNALYVQELVSRPSFYFWSRFYSEGSGESNWMGDDDMRPDTDSELDRCVGLLKEAYDRYAALGELHGEPMSRYEVSGNVRRVTFSCGTVLTADYDTGKVTVQKNGKNAPESF